MEREYIAFTLDVPKAIRLKSIARQKGVSLSELLRNVVASFIESENDPPGVLLDAEIVRETLDVDPQDIEAVVQGQWGRVEKESILAHALAYAQKRYPERVREAGIFATLVEGFTTGLWSGFGQDEDPLFQKAYREVIEYVGGTPPNKYGIALLPELSKKHRVALTREILKLLESTIFSPDTL